MCRWALSPCKWPQQRPEVRSMKLWTLKWEHSSQEQRDSPKLLSQDCSLFYLKNHKPWPIPSLFYSWYENALFPPLQAPPASVSYPQQPHITTSPFHWFWLLGGWLFQHWLAPSHFYLVSKFFSVALRCSTKQDTGVLARVPDKSHQKMFVWIKPWRMSVTVSKVLLKKNYFAQTQKNMESIAMRVECSYTWASILGFMQVARTMVSSLNLVLHALNNHWKTLCERVMQSDLHFWQKWYKWIRGE